MRERWRFETSCINAFGIDITGMVQGAKQVSYRTFRNVVGEPFGRIQRELGYDTGSMRGGLRMSEDWAVSYFRSRYRGLPCMYFRWSAIEHVFVDQLARRTTC